MIKIRAKAPGFYLCSEDSTVLARLVALGNKPGLQLFDEHGMRRAMLFIGERPKLGFYDEQGDETSSLP